MNLREEVQLIGQANPRRRQRACDLIVAYDSALRLTKSKVQAVRYEAQIDLTETERAMEIFTGCASCDGKTK